MVHGQRYGRHTQSVHDGWIRSASSALHACKTLATYLRMTGRFTLIYQRAAFPRQRPAPPQLPGRPAGLVFYYSSTPRTSSRLTTHTHPSIARISCTPWAGAMVNPAPNAMVQAKALPVRVAPSMRMLCLCRSDRCPCMPGLTVLSMETAGANVWKLRFLS